MSFSEPGEYELLDFGGGRTLERFGRRVLDRPTEAASCERPRRVELWATADARYESAEERGRWTGDPSLDPWSLSFAGLTLELKLTPFGHVGLFPEHATVWRELAARCRQRPQPPQVLNLFAYTGGATLAAAAAGAAVTHVDAADNIVRWSRRNAELSKLADRPIRWMVDDARQFTAREVRRERRYDVVLLDPPAFGHGPRGQRWSIDRDLPKLLADCQRLLAPSGWLAISCHSRGYDRERLEQLAASCTGRPATGQNLSLTTADGRTLELGAVAWSSLE